ncbi:hypothetical protein AB0G42_31935 [Streptomyces yangpuensis]
MAEQQMYGVTHCAQLRARRPVAARTGAPLAGLLGQADPLETR